MSLKAEFANITNYFSPIVINEVNNQYVKVARIKGQKVPWHNYRISATDECFIMLIETKTTAHTGKVKSEIIKSIELKQLKTQISN